VAKNKKSQKNREKGISGQFWPVSKRRGEPAQRKFSGKKLVELLKKCRVQPAHAKIFKNQSI